MTNGTRLFQEEWLILEKGTKVLSPKRVFVFPMKLNRKEMTTWIRVVLCGTII